MRGLQLAHQQVPEKALTGPASLFTFSHRGGYTEEDGRRQHQENLRHSSDNQKLET